MDFKKNKKSSNFIDKTGVTSEIRARLNMLFDFLTAPQRAKKSYFPDYEGERYRPTPVPTVGPYGNRMLDILTNPYLFEPRNSAPEPGGIYDQQPMGYDDISQDNIDAMNKLLLAKKKKK
jgi:hypothetical protein